jgi:hypothetical protein
MIIEEQYFPTRFVFSLPPCYRHFKQRGTLLMYFLLLEIEMFCSIFIIFLKVNEEAKIKEELKAIEETKKRVCC